MQASHPLDRRLTDAFGAATAKQLERAFGHRTVGDLLAHYPRRYAHRGDLTPLKSLQVGEEVTIVARVAHVSTRRMAQRKGSILEAVITDGTGQLSLTFFNQDWRMANLLVGSAGLFSGKVGSYRGGLQLAHPDYELFGLEVDEQVAASWANLPIPVYPATASLTSWKMRDAIRVVLDTVLTDSDGAGGTTEVELPDPIPDVIRAERGLMSWRRALELVHRPQADDDWRRARETLRTQEALVLQTALVQRRDALRALHAVPREPGAILAGFDETLPFALTDDQRAAGATIGAELAGERPMNRLVQGEVGSGKTLVALRGMLQVAQSGGQSALLAPTEVLAQQHLRSIVKALGPDLAARMRPVLFTGQLNAADRKRASLAIASGSALIVIGTHALLGERVLFADLGLVVVDEQHRFGVEQRDTLRAKGLLPPHLLVLTATPIPRTVAMTVFGDLDVTTIAQLPAGRQPIESFVVPLAEKPAWEPRIWSRIAEELEQGRQAFVVCPAIDSTGAPEDDDALDLDGAAAEDDGAPARPIASVAATLERLAGMPVLAGARIRGLHGRMTTDEKDDTMRAFAAGEIDVLVSTTVIEVGVDVPNASVMVVLDADRFGVSQLHQLRGRVGRGSVPGIALFVTAAPVDSLARERVDAVAATTDGFELAERDLQMRHEGDVLGATQSGRRSSLRLLSAATDGELIAQAREDAIRIIASDPDLLTHPALVDAMARRLDAASEAFLTRA
jgi:ATP-dependent DNA helicase RecG